MKQLAAVLAAMPLVAHADARSAKKPDPAVDRAADANLESQSRRKGLTLQFGIGGAITFGFGYDETLERGVGTSLRLGTVARDNLVFTIEALNFTLLHKPATMDGSMSQTQKNLVNNALVGAQIYVNPVLWVRGAVGFNSYIGERVERGDGTIGDLRTAGLAGAFGAGVELLRFRRGVALGFEIVSMLARSKEGTLSSSSFMIDLSID
jgi:hypothetical protein